MLVNINTPRMKMRESRKVDFGAFFFSGTFCVELECMRALTLLTADSTSSESTRLGMCHRTPTVEPR